MSRQKANEIERLIAWILVFLTFLIGSTCNSQTVIVNGDFTEAYDNLPNDVTIGNNCEVNNFMSLYYNGDLLVKGDIYIKNAIVTVYGAIDFNGYNIYWECDNSDLIQEPTLSVNVEEINDFSVYPNPTNGLFYVN